MGFDLLIKKRQEKKQRIDVQTLKPLYSLYKLIDDIDLHIPSGLLISKGHVWIKDLPDGKMRVGLDDFCPGLLTKVDSIKLHKSGDRINDNEGMCTLYQGEKKLSFFSPFDGIIQEVNPLLLENPKILCIDPFNKGWVYSINPSFEMPYLLDRDQIVQKSLEWQKIEKEKLVDFIQEEPAMEKKLEQKFKEGKFSLKGLLDSLDKLSWLKFEENFLK